MSVRKIVAASAAVCVLVIGCVGVQSAFAAHVTLSGPASCDLLASNGIATMTPPLPAQTPSTKISKFAFASDLGTCQNANAALAIARITIKGLIPKGASCASLFAGEEPIHLPLSHANIKVKWIGRDGERFGTSSAHVTGVTLTESPAYALDFTTGPIRGTFHGESISLHAGIQNLLELSTECSNPAGSVPQINFAPVQIYVA